MESKSSWKDLAQYQMHSYFKNNVASISFATSLSKVAGFIRQIFIAAAFGIGITYDAYNYAYIIPGFLLIIMAELMGHYIMQL